MAHANDATRNGVADARLHDARDHESRSHDGARSARGVRKPRYQQIADTLREEIRRGEHAVGRFLESEAELKARFKEAGLDLLLMSAATRDGVKTVLEQLRTSLQPASDNF